jgi:hypothetical protein
MTKNRDGAIIIKIMTKNRDGTNGTEIIFNFIKVEKESIAVLKSSFLTLFHII